MNYRRASAKDIEELSQMRWVFQTESAESDPVWTKEQFIQACADFYTSTIESPNWIFWVAEDEDKLVAQVSIHIINNIPSPHRFINKWGYLTNVYTAQTYRNQGIGAQLMERVIEEAKGQGIETLIVWPSDRSVAFYQRAGFTGVNEIMELSVG